MEEIGPVAAACGVVAERGPLELALGEAVWLPSRRPRVLAVRLEDPHGAAAALQRRLADALAAGGWYRPEARPYLGHVSVARLAHGVRVRPGPVAVPPGAALTASTVTLFRSRRGAGGARYEPLQSVPLRGLG